MLRDVKRRRLVKEYATDHLRINSLRKNILVPREIQASTVLISVSGLDPYLMAWRRERCRL